MVDDKTLGFCFRIKISSWVSSDVVLLRKVDYYYESRIKRRSDILQVS